MELAELVNTQYAFPVGIVMICAVFVFVFGFKSSNPPEFNQLVHAADDRRTAGKKRKLKDKKSVQNNLSSSPGSEEGRKQKLESLSKVSVGKASKQTKNTKNDEPAKGQVPSNKQQLSKAKKNVSQKENFNESVVTDGKSKTKDGKLSLEAKKNQPPKEASLQIDLKVKSQEKRLLKEKNYNIQQVKNARNSTSDGKTKSTKSSKSKINEEKPIDFDDGEWEQAISRKEKKSKKKDEESLLAADAKNIGASSTPMNQSITVTQSNNDNTDLSASAISGGANTLIHHSGSSKDTPTAPAGVTGHVNAVSGDVLAVELLNGEAEKKETGTKASESSAPQSSAIEKSKSSKSKGKNKESALSSGRKDVTSQENGNVSTGNVQQSVDETSKSKKKKKQINAADNKDEKSSNQHVESSKQLNVEVETPNRDGEQAVVHDITSSAKVEPASAVVFDELGDVWKEAKAPKKSKKKVRKDQ